LQKIVSLSPPHLRRRRAQSDRVESENCNKKRRLISGVWLKNSGMLANYAYKVYISIHNAEPCVFAPAAKKNAKHFLLLRNCSRVCDGERRRLFRSTLEKPKTLYARKVAFMEVERTHTALHGA
jgi:hypothetical protein